MNIRTLTPLALTLVLGCTGKDEEEESLPPIGHESEVEDCYGAAPEARGLTLGNGGVQRFDDGDFPTILFSVDGYDADGNLDLVTLELWWEDDGDGSIDASGAPLASHTYTVTGSPCDSFEAPIELLLQVGTSLEYNTIYDFAARFEDSSGDVSNVVSATGSTPRSNGADGDGTG